MLTYYDPFQPGPMAPIGKPGWNVGIWTNNDYNFFRILFVEGIPPSRQTTQDIGSLGANSTGTQTEMTVINAQEGALVQTRCRVLDNFEAQIHQPTAHGLHVTDQQHVRLSLSSLGYDPNSALSTAFIYGSQQALYVTPHNNSDYALAKTRLVFWGARYIIERVSEDKESALRGLMHGDEENARRMGLQATIVSAVGRMA